MSESEWVGLDVTTDPAPPPTPPGPQVEGSEFINDAPPFVWQRNRRGWRYFATRLNGDGTETILDMDLPLEDVGIEDIISGDQALQATISPAYSRLIDSNGDPLLREWSTAIYAENDGDIRFGGILTDSGFDGPNWELDCVGFTGYARDMPWTAAAPVSNDPPGWNVPANKDGSGLGIEVDPIDMVRVIWDQIQAQGGGNINFDIANTNTSGKVSIGTTLTQVQFMSVEGPVFFESGPYKLNWHSNHDLARDIDNLANETPFDYHEKHSWNADGTIRHFLDIGYPRIGRRRTDLRFVHGVNVFDPVKMNRDGSIYASGTMVLGAGEGASMVKSVMEPPSRPGNRLRRIAVVLDDSIKSKRRADARARAENQWRARIDDTDTLVVRDHPNARLGAAQVGDEIRVEGRGDWVGIDMWVRILSVSYRPDTGDVAEYKIARTDKLTS